MGVRLLHYSDIENAYDDPERVGRLAGTIRARRDRDTLVVGTGDNTGPGVLALATGGEQALDFFERVDPDLETFGNHDFDHGLDRTRDLVDASPQTWVCANVRRNGGRFAADAGAVPATVVEAGGRRLGVFGVLDAATPSITPAAERLSVADPVDAAREAVADLRDRGVDHVIGLSHLADPDALARGVDVDVLLGGHVHDERVDRIDGTPFARPGATGRVLLELRLEAGEWTVERHDVTAGPLDQAVADALRERLAAAGLDEVVATVDAPMSRSRGAIEAGETRLGVRIADAYRWATGADVGLQNTGGIREGPPIAGDVTAADLVGLVPFDEPVAIAELSGDELRALLGELRDGDAWMGYVAGADVAWDGDRVGTARIDGAPIDHDATYTLATSDYLCYTDREFPTLSDAHRVDTTDRRQYEVLVDYARETGVRDPVGGPTP